MLEALYIALLFFLGKGFSIVFYQACWLTNKNGASSPWWQHLLWLPVGVAAFSLSNLSWGEFPVARAFASVVAFQLAFAAAGRFNPTRPGILRGIVVVGAAGFVYWYPGLLVVSLGLTLLVQYRQACWGLSSGYSNLLGFEFSRSSACSLIAVLTVAYWFPWVTDVTLLSVLLLHQASYYINHALAKSAIGKTWYEWIGENRIQFLISNAWLRGWTLGMSRSRCLSVCQWVAKYRVTICCLAWLTEISWVFVLIHQSAPVYLYAVTLIFHLVILLVSGLSCWHFVINHGCMLFLIFHFSSQIASSQVFWASLVVFALAAMWVGFTKTRLLASQRSGARSNRWLFVVDASDHLMAWWDSPYMRMYSYTVETASGKSYFLPVTKLSPYDTVLTDIHTHLMILDCHAGFDGNLEEDKKIARTGVWGLIAEREEKEKVYDSSFYEQMKMMQVNSAAPWVIDKAVRETAHPAVHLIELFEAINRCIESRLYRWRLKWPHFPGEDHSPDRCPLIDTNPSDFPMNESIQVVRVWCAKTWVEDHGFTLLDHTLCGEIHLNNDP